MRLTPSPTRTPQFSGFYAIKKNYDELKQLPIGKHNGIPNLPYLSPNIPDMTWLYVFPETELPFEKILNDNQIKFEYDSDRTVREKFAEGDEKTAPIRGPEDVDLIRSWLTRWGGSKMSALIASAFSDITKI